MRQYGELEHTAAAESFVRAFELDPSFYVAAFYAGLNYGNAGDAERAREMYEKAAEGRDRMSDYYRHRLDAQMASFNGEGLPGYYEANRKAALAAPGSKAAAPSRPPGATGRPRRPRSSGSWPRRHRRTTGSYRCTPRAWPASWATRTAR